MAYVKTVPYTEASGQTKAAYDELIRIRGSVGNVFAVNAIRPHIMKSLEAHARTVMRSDSGVSPAERQMIATVVSAVNRCQY